MNLFNYLMNKNDKEIVDNNHLLEYLLNAGKLTSISGTELNITAKKTIINELIMTKESTQDGTPSPDYPQEVKTVKGYRNLLDLTTTLIPNRTNKGITTTINDNQTLSFVGIANSSDNKRYFTSDDNDKILCKAGTYRILSNYSETVKLEIRKIISNTRSDVVDVFTSDEDFYIYNGIFTLTNNKNYNETIWLQLTEGNQALPYVPYGNNYIAVNISDGTDTNYYTIPLNNNEIVGIGNYKDELIVDKNGKCWLNKKIGKVILNGSENWAMLDSTIPFKLAINNLLLPRSNNAVPSVLSDYYKVVAWNTFSTAGDYFLSVTSTESNLRIRNNNITTLIDFKTWLSTHNVTVYYALVTSELIDLNYTADIRLFNGINNISNSDDMTMALKYYS